jgi:hypothetical protein
MPANAEEALKAMEAALGTTTPAAAQEQDPPTGNENDEQDPPEGEESGDEGGDPPEGDENDGEDPPEGDEGEEGDGEEGEEGAEGAEGEGGEAETPEQKAERERQEAEAAKKPPDHVNDPIPEGLSKRTTERMSFLANRVRELEPMASQGEELIGYINSSGMNAEEFGMALTFGRFKHSDNVDDHRKAYAILWQGLKELAPLIGETLPGVDPLEGHQDLKDRVTAKTLDPKDAAELAAGRNRRKAEQTAMQRASQNVQATTEQRRKAAELEEATRVELNDLGRQLAATDPQFEVKMKALQAAPRGADGLTPMQRIKNAPPQLRVNAFLKAFLAAKPAAPKAGVAAGGKTPGRQPLRAGKVPAAGGAGVKREPKSPIEAMDFALGLK